MGCETFKPRRFNKASRTVIDQANDIIAEYQADGLVLTLRQLYYQFVSRALLDNKQSNYKRLGSILSAGRLAGLVDWSAMEDITRNVRRLPSWDDPADIIYSAAASYKEDLWRSTQKYVPEVWIEKDALLGVIERVCNKHRVPFYSCRGYSSQSETYEAGKRFEKVRLNQQIPIVLHLGDHDPSGLDMTRDNAKRLEMFAYEQVEVRRLALNFDQVQRYNPPPNPAKEKDSRAPAYMKRFGRKSWELDALDPKVISQLIEDEIKTFFKPAPWAKGLKHEDGQKAILRKASDYWSNVERFLEDL